MLICLTITFLIITQSLE
jgi:hypothetical protein